jgi:hypothetical protein
MVLGMFAACGNNNAADAPAADAPAADAPAADVDYSSMTIDELSMTTDGWTETVTMDAWFAYYTEFDMPEIPQYTDLLKADEEAIDEMIAVFEEFITGAFGGMMGEAVPDYGYAY